MGREEEEGEGEKEERREANSDPEVVCVIECWY